VRDVVELQGGRDGPNTELRASAGEDPATVCLQGTKSGRWLGVVDGELTSLAEAEPLLVQYAAKRGREPEDEPGNEKGVAAGGGGDYKRLRVAGGGAKAALAWPVRICPKGKAVLLTTEAGGNVACGPGGQLHSRGAGGQWAQWQLQESPAGLALRNVGHSKYLAVDESGRASLSEEATLFSADVAPESFLAEARPLPVDQAVLPPEELRRFREEGYVVLRGAVPQELVRNALRVINYSLGKPDCWQADSNPLNAGQLMPKITGGFDDILGRSPALWSAVNVLLGPGDYGGKRQPQVALRFPRAPEEGFDAPDRRPRTQYHIDGMGQGQTKLCPFSLLCGVALSDQSRPNCGNLHVFPRSHLSTELREYYRSKIADEGQGESDTQKPDVGEPTQVLLAPGDVVLAHQLLAHRIGINRSAHIRYQLFYRIRHPSHEQFKERIIDEPFVEFPSV